MNFSLSLPPIRPIPEPDYGGAMLPAGVPLPPLTDNAMDSENDPVYICCGKPFGGKFMIFCEKCEQWFHGECIGIEQSFANNIDKYYCKDCLGKDGSLDIVFTKKYLQRMEKKKKEEDDLVAKRCGKCITCLKIGQNESTCLNCSYCLKDQPHLCLALRCIQVLPMRKKAGRPRKDTTLTRSASDSDGPMSPLSPSDDKPKRGRKKGWNKVKAIEKVTKAETMDADRKSLEEYDRDIARQVYREANMRARAAKKKQEPEEEPTQCLGIDCIYESRPGSKYCSDDCGRSIARARLLRFLPQKVKEYWKTIPQSEIRYHALAKEKETQIVAINVELQKLLGMVAMMERYANSLTKAQPNVDEGSASEVDGITCCTVCGVECSSKQLANHIFRCFVRSEKQTAFGSHMQENQYAIFCNEYNKASDTYCKRLKIMCPEHYKGDLENNMSVCGCPKIWDMIKDKTPSFQEIFVSAEQLMSKRFCLAPRRECSRHGRWLQLSLGIINNERLNLLYKLNELQEAYMSFANAIPMHGDLITLLCSGSRKQVTKDEPMQT